MQTDISRSMSKIIYMQGILNVIKLSFVSLRHVRAMPDFLIKRINLHADFSLDRHQLMSNHCVENCE